MNVAKNNIVKIKKEFFKITGILPVHLINRIEDKYIRKDSVFQALSEKVFDYPELLNTLVKKAKYWLRLDKGEFVYSLAGYIYYLNEDFTGAENCFLKAIIVRPENLDNWLDLAFSLYHQNDRKHNLGKNIIFNFDYCVNVFKNRKNKKFNIKMLENTLGAHRLAMAKVDKSC